MIDMNHTAADGHRPHRRRRLLIGVVAAALAVMSTAVVSSVRGTQTTATPPTSAGGTPAVSGDTNTDDKARPVRPALPGNSVKCPFDTSSFDLQLQCGRVQVPENHDTGSGEVALLVTIARSPGTPTKPPLLLLAGGPGIGGVAEYAPLLSDDAGRRLAAGRDLVIVDQRGTGFTKPRLQCPIIDPAVQATAAASRQVGAQCVSEYRKTGIDVAAFTTAAAAADLVAVRKALGLPSWDVYGVSYGTTLALTLLRHADNGVDRVVLDSVSPVQDVTLAVDVVAKDAYLRILLTDCARDRACAHEHPNLDSRLTAALPRLNKNPLNLGDTPISGDALLFFVTNTAVATRENRPRLPDVIDAALHGDGGPLAAVIEGAGDDPSLPTTILESAANDGLGLAVTCAEDAPLFTRDVTDRLTDRGPYAAALTRLTSNYLAACQTWDLPTLPAGAKAPVQSNRPTLTISGEQDPSTPPSGAARAAHTLPNSQQIVVPNEGHATLFNTRPNSCLTDTLKDFLDRSPIAPTRCLLADYPPLPFQ